MLQSRARRRFCAAAAVAASMLASQICAVQASPPPIQRYNIVQISGLDFYTRVFPSSLNNSGTVSGSLYSPSSVAYRGFIWGTDPLSLTGFSTFYSPFPFSPLYDSGVAEINDVGDLVGFDINHSAYVYYANHTAHQLITGEYSYYGLPTAVYGYGVASSINPLSAAIVGSAHVIGPTGNDTGVTHAMAWINPFAMQDLGTLGGNTSAATHINRLDHVSGWAQVVGGATHAFFGPAGGGLTDIGTLGGDYSRADSINDNDQLVGNATTTGLDSFLNPIDHAFLCNFKSTTDHALTDLGTLGGPGSAATGINNNGEVVGEAQLGTLLSPGDFHAFRWDPVNGMVDLNNLLPAGSGWVLGNALKINDNGQILVTGFLNGVAATALLQPVPPPTIVNITPNLAPLNSPTIVVTVNGSGFNTQSQVNFASPYGVSPTPPTTFISSHQLQFTLFSSYFYAIYAASISVTNPVEGTSNTVPFNVVGVPKLVIQSASATRDPSTHKVTVTVTVFNSGTANATNATINAAANANLSSVSTISTMPFTIGAVPIGGTSTFILTFPSTVTAGSKVLNLSIAVNNGTSSGTKPITVP